MDQEEESMRKAKDGGSGEIRTHGWFDPSPVFKTGALNRSATLPLLDWNRFRDWPEARHLAPELLTATGPLQAGAYFRMKCAVLLTTPF